MVFKKGFHCEKCGKRYTNMISRWCRLCQSSGNEQIDDFIQEKQLNIHYIDDTVFEWIPYDQFDNIKEIGKSDSIKIYSAIWKDGPLDYNTTKRIYERSQGKKITLKHPHNSQNISEFLNEVLNLYIKFNSFF